MIKMPVEENGEIVFKDALEHFISFLDIKEEDICILSKKEIEKIENDPYRMTNCISGCNEDFANEYYDNPTKIKDELSSKLHNGVYANYLNNTILT
jgi:hypothetical protein